VGEAMESGLRGEEVKSLALRRSEEGSFFVVVGVGVVGCSDPTDKDRFMDSAEGGEVLSMGVVSASRQLNGFDERSRDVRPGKFLNNLAGNTVMI